MSLNGRSILGDGPVVIPAHPLAVGDDGAPDWVSQRVLTQYYVDAGATGLAVGVHTTQFEIHDDDDLLRRTLQEAADVATASGRRMSLVAGVAGDADQAVREAELAKSLGYEAALLCPYGVSDKQPDVFLERAKRVAEVLPALGFYMQDSVGGSYLPETYWRELFEVPGVIGAKVAPFDRYRTADVMRAFAASSRRDELVLITGNDDAILPDLVTPWNLSVNGQATSVQMSGGLLGQWAVGTRAAVQMTEQAYALRGKPVPAELLAEGSDLVTINQAVFDTAHNFAGAVAGVNEVLRQQGLIASTRCLAAREKLSVGQQELIERARKDYPDLLDESFIAENLDRWRAAAR